MTSVRSAFPFLLFAILACSSGEPGAVETNPVIVETRTGDIRLDEFQFYLARWYPELTDPIDDEIGSRALDRLVRDSIVAELHRVAEERVDDLLLHELGIGDSFLEMSERNRELWRNEARRRFAVQEFLRRDILSSINISDEVVTDFYQANEDRYKREPIYRVRFVQTDERARAEELRKVLAKSRDPFVDVAAPFAVNDGHLVAVPIVLEELPEPFGKPLRRLRPGQYSRIIPIAQGDSELFYVLYLESVEDAEQPLLEEVYFHIRKELERKRARQLFDEKVDRFRQIVPVRIHYDLLPFTYREPASDKEV